MNHNGGQKNVMYVLKLRTVEVFKSGKCGGFWRVANLKDAQPRTFYLRSAPDRVTRLYK